MSQFAPCGVLPVLAKPWRGCRATSRDVTVAGAAQSGYAPDWRRRSQLLLKSFFFFPWIFNFSMDYPTLFHFPWIQQGFSNGFFDSNCSGNFCRDDAVMEVSPALPNDPIETWVSCHYPIGSTYLGYTVVLNLSNTHVISCNQTWSTSTSMEKQVATSDQK